MNDGNFLKKIEEFWPKDAPDINNVPKYIDKYKNEIVIMRSLRRQNKNINYTFLNSFLKKTCLVQVPLTLKKVKKMELSILYKMVGQLKFFHLKLLLKKLGMLFQ